MQVECKSALPELQRADAELRRELDAANAEVDRLETELSAVSTVREPDPLHHLRARASKVRHT